MPKTEKRDIRFKSADGQSMVAGFFYTCEEAPPVCVLQISHGMCEYMGRYEDFARFLAGQGVAVCGNDHLGHGETANHPDDYGYFTEKNGRRHILEDLKTMNQKAHEAFPGLPVVLLGHSMGSFFARRYAVLWPESIQGLILSGTGGKNPLAGAGIALVRALQAVYGPRHRSRLVRSMAFGSYLNKIEKPLTRFDWVSRDMDVVRDYSQNPLCNFTFTLNGFHELFKILDEVSSPAWAVGVTKDMPVYLFSGDADPVGDYGKGVVQVAGWLRGAGVKHLEYKLYPGGRHEMLNELGREEVYADVLAVLRGWCERYWGE